MKLAADLASDLAKVAQCSGINKNVIVQKIRIARDRLRGMHLDPSNLAVSYTKYNAQIIYSRPREVKEQKFRNSETQKKRMPVRQRLFELLSKAC